MVSQPLRIAGRKLKRQVRAEPSAVGEHTLQPLNQVMGFYGSDANERAGVAFLWLRVTPLEVIVRGPDGREQRVEIVDATGSALRGVAVAGLVVALGCWLTILWSWRNRRKASKGGHR